jgi:hypothetical protein
LGHDEMYLEVGRHEMHVELSRGEMYVVRPWRTSEHV